MANQERVARGLTPLRVDARLTSAAYAKGQDMLAKGYWAHFGPNGETPWQFIVAAGYQYQYAGENLAKDFSNTNAVHQAWMNSPTHRANIIKPEYRDIGISVVEGTMNGEPTILVVQMFGAQFKTTKTTTIGSDTNKPPTNKTNTTPKPKPNIRYTYKPSPKPPSAPEITEPNNGSLLNKSEFDIKGKSQEGASVDVYDGNSKIGSLTAKGGIFTYRTQGMSDGRHSLSAKAKLNGLESKKSNTVLVDIDTTAPQIKTEHIELLQNRVSEGNYNFKINLGDIEGAENVKLVMGDTEYQFKKQDDGFVGELIVPESILASTGENVKIVAKDKAGNETNLEIPKKEILGIDVKSLPDIDYNSDKEVDTKLSASTILDGFSIKKTINLSFAIFLLMIFAIDLVYIWKDPNTRDMWSIRHIPVFVFLILITFINASGEII